MSKDGKDLRPATKLVEAGRRPEWTGRVVNPPVWRASTHLYDSEAQRRAAGKKNADGEYHYGRRGAATQWALADALTEMEPGAHGTVLFPSGLAAIVGALMAVLRPGDELLMCDNAYEPSRTTATGLLKRWGITARFYDPLDVDGFAAHFTDKTRAVWLENPGSLTMEVCDIPALAAIAGENGAVSLLDNTWASPLGFAGLEHGCDIVVMSLSKHVGGHSDLMMGSASAGERYYRALRRTAQQVGHVVSPDDAALALRGLRTMGLRLERSAQNAQIVAEWLSTRPEVAQVLCPLLPDDRSHALWQRDFTGGCGLFSFALAGGNAEAQAQLVDNLELFGIGYSWGGYESLALPFDASPIRECMAWPPEGVEAGTACGIRLSIGLEDPQDLIADLEKGLAATGAA